MTKFKFSARSSVKAIVLLLASAALTGCFSSETRRGSFLDHEQFQIAEKIEKLELYSQPEGIQLNARDRQAVGLFLRDYGANANGPLHINLPYTQISPLGVQKTQAIIQQAMLAEGLDPNHVKLGQYNVPHGRIAPVVVSYRKLSVVIPKCDRIGNLLYSRPGQPYDGFGCSHFANQAAMIGDVNQLIGPYKQTPADQRRRSRVYQNYLEGADSSSANGSRQDIDFGQ